MENNIILKKLKVALSLTSEDVLDVLMLSDVDISKNKLSCLLCKDDNRHYQRCSDLILKGFLNGLIKQRR
jgi:uncharacterized protein YehS (DUF1456 family)